MDAVELAEYLRGKGIDMDADGKGLDYLRCAFADVKAPEIRVRLRATPRCVKGHSRLRRDRMEHEQLKYV